MNNLKQRLESHSAPGNNGCIEWTHAKRAGYGCMKVSGKLESAHRISFMVHRGEIPDGYFICHICDNRKCINPDHLFIGSHRDNMIDAYKKGRVKPPCNEPRKHPSVSAYMRGCRCRECKDIMMLRQRKIREIAKI